MTDANEQNIEKILVDIARYIKEFDIVLRIS